MDAAAQRDIPARRERVREILRSCRLCPRACGVNRMAGERGVCGLDAAARCFREMISHNEEHGLSPSHQVYFAGCNLRCEFCTVAEWTERPSAAAEMDAVQLAAAVARRRGQGARNLNLLGGEPTVSVFGILDLLARIDPAVTVVWNSNMYFDPVVFEVLAGLVDVYLADFKCGNAACGRKLLGARDYVDTVQRNLVLARARAGLVIRHVVLPGHGSCCRAPMARWLARTMPDVAFSLRSDYVPPVPALETPGEYVGPEEYADARTCVRAMGVNLVDGRTEDDERSTVQTKTRRL